MELSQVKTLVIPEGEVRQIKTRINGTNTVVWETAPSVRIVKDNSQPIELIYYVSKTQYFYVRYVLPDEVLENNTFTGTISNNALPSGVSCSYMKSSKKFSISSYPTEIGEGYEVTFTITIGEYTDSKTYNIRVIDDGNRLTLNNPEFVFYDDQTYTYTFTGRSTWEEGDIIPYVCVNLECVYLMNELGISFPDWRNLESNYEGDTYVTKISGCVPVDGGGGNLLTEYLCASSTNPNNGYTYYTPPTAITYRAYNILPKFKHTLLTVDISDFVRAGSVGKELRYVITSEAMHNLDDVRNAKNIGVGFASSTTYADYPTTEDSVNIYAPGNTGAIVEAGVIYDASQGGLILRIELLKRYSGTSAQTKSYYATIKNSFGSSFLTIRFYWVSKSDYTANSEGKYYVSGTNANVADRVFMEWFGEV